MQAARSAKKKQKLLSRDFVRKHNIPKMLFNDVLMDIANQNYYSTRFGTGYLTQRQLDLDLVNALSAKPVRDTNALLSEAFTHEIPVVAGVNLKDLIRIRLNEGDAFQIYRDALAKAINDAKGEDPRKLRQVFRDVVNPELNRLNGALASARKTLVRDSLLAGGVASGLVGVGLFSGILPPNLSAIVTLLGGYHFFEKTTTKLAQIVLEPNDARKNSYYFLWKVARHARKS